MSDVHSTILELERGYAIHKEKFDNWKKANAKLAGHASYNSYVEQFLTWEKGVFEQLRELRASCFRQPVGPEPQLPIVDLNTQLNEALNKISQPEFMMAVFSMAQKDPTFLKKVFEVVHRESKGTGYSNSIMLTPQNMNTPSQPPPLLYLSTNTLSAQSSYLSNNHGPPQNNVGNMPGQPVQQVYTQMTQYGAIPEGWVFEAPIRKRQRVPSPPRDYRKPANLTFKDFSQ